MKKRKGLVLLFCLALFANGCGRGLNIEDTVEPNYGLLGQCDRPDLLESTALVKEALCGTFSVAEDPDNPDQREIQLHVMLLPATSSVARPDPVFFLAGGPGQSAVDTGVQIFSQMAELRRERDVVLVDQRGTGRSNGLNCEWDDNAEALMYTATEREMHWVRLMQECLDRFSADVAFYTTSLAMDDLNRVREVLGYKQINLVGISYGTRAGLVFMRRHGQWVRSAVFDGVAPLSMKIPANISIDANDAFAKVLRDCNAQPACVTAFPDLASGFSELMERLKEAPEKIEFAHSRTGKVHSALIDADIFSGILRNVLYERTLSTLVPFAIEKARRGDFQPVMALATMFETETPIISMGMMASVLCSEDMRMVDDPNLVGHFSNPVFSQLAPICDFWPRGSLPEGYFEPVQSEKPTLLLSGELDPVTPPRYALQAMESLSNSQHVVVAGVGHNVILQGCLPEIVTEFIDQPMQAEVDTACLASLKRKAFFTDYAGPAFPNLGAVQSD